MHARQLDEEKINVKNVSESVMKGKSHEVAGKENMNIPDFLTGGKPVKGFGTIIGDALCLLYVSRHGLTNDELFSLLIHVLECKDWTRKTIGSIATIESKLFEHLHEYKNRLIDIFRSFDTDGNGVLSHEEFRLGLQRLDIDVSVEQIEQLIQRVDSNNDGDIDYRETLDFFAAHNRQYAHGKRKFSTVGMTTSKTQSDDSSSEKEAFFHIVNDKIEGIKPRMKEFLSAALLSLGVILVKGEVFSLSLECDVLREVIWERYIVPSGGEEQWRMHLTNFFTRHEPSQRRCEELPWHLHKSRKWVSLKFFLTDLRTFDIMYNKDIFKEELFRYFRILTEMFSSVSHKRLNKRSLIKRDNSSCRQPRVNTKISFDLVDEMNHAVELWYNGAKVSTERLCSMVTLIGEFMAWFSAKMSQRLKSATFKRKTINLEHLGNIRVHETAHWTRLSSKVNALTKDPLQWGRKVHNIEVSSLYLFDRWLWIQFPWLTLSACEEMAKAHVRNTIPKCHRVTDVDTRKVEKLSVNEIGKDRRFWEVKKEDPHAESKSKSNITRDTAMVHAEVKKKSAAIQIVEKLIKDEATISYETENQNNSWTSTKPVHHNDSAIPFAHSSIRSQKHGSRFPSVDKIYEDQLEKENDIDDFFLENVRERFGGSKKVKSLEDVIESRRADEIIDSAVKGKDIAYLPAHSSTFAATPKEIEEQEMLSTIGKLRDIHDKLRVERCSKAKRVEELEEAGSLRETSDNQVHNHIVDGEKKIDGLQQKLHRTDYVLNYVSQVGTYYERIEYILSMNHPAKDKNSLKALEQQIVLSRQQLSDLLEKQHKFEFQTNRVKRRDLLNWKKKLIHTKEELISIKKEVSQLFERQSAALPTSDCEAETKQDDAFTRNAKFLGMLERRVAYFSPSSVPKNSVDKQVDDGIPSDAKKSEISPTQEMLEGCLQLSESSDDEIDDPNRTIAANKGLDKQRLEHEKIIENLKTQLRIYQMQIEELNVAAETKTPVTDLDNSNALVNTEDSVEEAELSYLQSVKKSGKQLGLVDESENGIRYIGKLIMRISKSKDLPTPQFHNERMEEQSSLEILNYIKSGMIQLLEYDEKRQIQNITVNVNKMGIISAIDNKDVVSKFSSPSCLIETTNDELIDSGSNSRVSILSVSEVESQYENKTKLFLEKQDQIANKEEASRSMKCDVKKKQAAKFVEDALNTSASKNEQRRANILGGLKQGKRADKGLIIEAFLQKSDAGDRRIARQKKRRNEEPQK